MSKRDKWDVHNGLCWVQDLSLLERETCRDARKGRERDKRVLPGPGSGTYVDDEFCVVNAVRE